MTHYVHWYYSLWGYSSHPEHKLSELSFFLLWCGWVLSLERDMLLNYESVVVVKVLIFFNILLCNYMIELRSSKDKALASLCQSLTISHCAWSCDFTIWAPNRWQLEAGFPHVLSHPEDMLSSGTRSGSNPGCGIFATGILGFILGSYLFLFLIFLVTQQCRKKIKCQGRF